MYSEKNGKLILLLIFSCIATLVFFRNAIRPSHYVTPDSISYLRAADLLQGKESKDIDPPTAVATNTLNQLLAVWPAGYPICITLLAQLTNSSSLLASKIVNVLFLGSIFILLFSWLGKNAWFPALYFFSFGKLEIFSYTWSEGPFFFSSFFYALSCNRIFKRKGPMPTYS